MSKIITLTFSPSLDKSATVDYMVPTKKLRCENADLEAGGGGINVARVLNMLGAQVTAVFPSGGYSGARFETLLAAHTVPFVSVPVKSDTKENFAVLDESTGEQYRFGMPSNPITTAEYEAILHEIQSHKDVDFIVVSGSLPPGVPLTVYKDIATIAAKGRAKLVVDTSGPALKNAVDQGVYLLKPNLNELAFLVGMDNLAIADVDRAAKDLITSKHCEIIVVSLAEKGAMLVTKDACYKIIPPSVTVRTTVGAGDSMLAGIIFSLSKGDELLQTLKYGVACGTAATLHFGSELCKIEDIEKLYGRIE